MEESLSGGSTERERNYILPPLHCFYLCIYFNYLTEFHHDGKGVRDHVLFNLISPVADTLKRHNNNSGINTKSNQFLILPTKIFAIFLSLLLCRHHAIGGRRNKGLFLNGQSIEATHCHLLVVGYAPEVQIYIHINRQLSRIQIYLKCSNHMKINNAFGEQVVHIIFNTVA